MIWRKCSKPPPLIRPNKRPNEPSTRATGQQKRMHRKRENKRTHPRFGLLFFMQTHLTRGQLSILTPTNKTFIASSKNFARLTAITESIYVTKTHHIHANKRKTRPRT